MNITECFNAKLHNNTGILSEDVHNEVKLIIRNGLLQSSDNCDEDGQYLQ